MKEMKYSKFHIFLEMLKSVRNDPSFASMEGCQSRSRDVKGSDSIRILRGPFMRTLQKPTI